MAFNPKVERWRSLVEQEIIRGSYPWAPEFVLALMQRESGGRTGVVNQNSGASGLLQVMQITLDTYNNNHRNAQVTMATLRATTESAAAQQIRVGLWTLGQYWRKAYKWLSTENQSQDIPLDELAKFSDAFYHAGPAGMKRASRNLPRPVKWEDWARRNPQNVITIHADAIWANTVANNPVWNMDAVDRWVRGSGGGGGGDDDDDIIVTPVDPTTPARNWGPLIALAIFAVASYFMSKQK